MNCVGVPKVCIFPQLFGCDQGQLPILLLHLYSISIFLYPKGTVSRNWVGVAKLESFFDRLPLEKCTMYIFWGHNKNGKGTLCTSITGHTICRYIHMYVKATLVHVLHKCTKYPCEKNILHACAEHTVHMFKEHYVHLLLNALNTCVKNIMYAYAEHTEHMCKEHYECLC